MSSLDSWVTSNPALRSRTPPDYQEIYNGGSSVCRRVTRALEVEAREEMRGKVKLVGKGGDCNPLLRCPEGRVGVEAAVV